MSNDEQILKILESMDKRFTGIEQRLDGMEQRLDQQGKDIAAIKQEQNRTATAVEALKAGQEDIRATMAMKQEVAGVERRLRAEITAAEERLRNDIEVSRADAKSDSLRILGRLDKQNSRLEDLEKATGTPNRHKN